MTRILLVNPWIHDFAAYDFWIKPVGLLSIGAVLKQFGYKVDLIDCLDRHHPQLLEWQGITHAKTKTDSTGKFHRVPIEKPSKLYKVSKRYCRYGMPVEFFEILLHSCPKPAVILVTSGMTYWYPGLEDTIKRLRERFPQIPIILGGVYATLCSKHARANIKPDFLIMGEGEEKTVRLIANITGGPGHDFRFDALDDLPLPAYDLYLNLISVPMLTSRGCPFHCTFCASNQMVDGYRRRSPERVVEEIVHWYSIRNAKHFAFYDDALLLNRDRHIKPILSLLLERKLDASFHTPNGLFPKEIDRELSELFYNVGFRTIRLSYETSNPVRQQEMHSKVSDQDLGTAIQNLESAGYSRYEIGVYVLMGLPAQPVEEIIESIAVVLSLGAKVHLASFSPIPGTLEFQRAVELNLIPADIDPLLTNNSIFPLINNDASLKTFEIIKLITKRMNRRLIEGVIRFKKEEVIAEFEKALVIITN